MFDDQDAGMSSVHLDRSCCLFLTGRESVSSGVYHPMGYELRLRGDFLPQHQLTHLHEIHHKVLNDDTSWGTALHICARHPQWAETIFPMLLAVCRTTHEVFASFLSVSLLSARHETAARVLDAYPAYALLARRMQRLLRTVPAGHRQDLAATGIARFCMGAPVLGQMANLYPTTVVLADLRSRDHPDHRLARVLALSDVDVTRAVRMADEAFGSNVDEVGLSEADAALDNAWRLWEDVFVAQLIGTDPVLAGLAVTSEIDQLRDATRLAALLRADGIHVDLPRPDDGPLSDSESVQRLLSAVRLPLRAVPWRGGLATLGADLDAAELVDLVNATTGGRRHLVLHGRPESSLLTQFEFGPSDCQHLAGLRGRPLMAVRAPVDQDDDELLLQVEVPTPDAFASLVAAAPDATVIATCLTVSCFLESDWQSDWWPVLHQHPLIVLVDSGLQFLKGSSRPLGDHQPVWGHYLELAHPYITGLVWHIDTHPHVMLALGDDLTIQLVAGQLADILGDRLSMQGSDWTQWGETLDAVISSLLGTENTLRFDILERS